MRFKREVASAILRELLTKDTCLASVPDVSHEDFVFHSSLLNDAGFIIAGVNYDYRETPFLAERITWDGYSRLSDFDEALGKEFDPKNFVRNLRRS